LPSPRGCANAASMIAVSELGLVVDDETDTA